MKAEFFKFYSNLNNKEYKYVNLQEERELAGILYLPAPISRDEFEINSTSNDLRLTAPISLEIINEIITGYGNNDFWLEIKNQDEIILFIGKILNIDVNLDNNECSINLSSISNVLKTNIPFKSFSKRCSNSLFDKHCKLNKNNFKYIPNLLIVNKETDYKIYIGTEKENSYFNFGAVVINGNYFQIYNHKDGYINLLYPCFDEIIESITIYPGCDKSTSSCSSKFNNINNYGGFPDIPSSNPAVKI